MSTDDLASAVASSGLLAGDAVGSRPGEPDARRLALEMFMAGERVDMGSLASRLGVGRTTLYRWVGDREQLIAGVMAEIAELAWATVSVQAEGPGLERVLDTARRFMELTASFEPLLLFVEREPELALRVLLRPDGPVPQSLRAGFAREVDAHLDGKVADDFVEIAVQVGTALEWAPIAIGESPEIERAVDLIRSLFQSGAGADAGRRG